MINEWVFRLSEKDNENVIIQGDVKSSVIIVCEKAAYNDNTASMLTAIIKAIQFDIEKDCRIIKADGNIDLSSLVHTPYQYLLVFGFAPENIGFQISPLLYHPLKFDQMTAVFSDGLDVLANDKLKKAKLWSTLQSIFLK
jgi:hypothetical protein